MRAGFLPALALLACSAQADVIAFTLSSIPLETDGATVYVLDEGDRFAAALGAGLPGDPVEALAEVRRRLATPEGRAARRRIEAASAGRAQAVRLGIGKLPAVVVDGRYVVYGVRDVRCARALIAAWRARHELSLRSGPGASSPPPTDRPPARSHPTARGPAGERP